MSKPYGSLVRKLIGRPFVIVIGVQGTAPHYKRKNMCNEKIEEILKTYPPVKGRPGWVWINKDTIARRKDIREAYKESFEPHEIITEEEGTKID